ncbi:MAG: hypothetical protein Q7R35_07845, partial [Elusimicrobiota bacterium]|nr:hypothetical protein [Elusimicrobiota bacterium]
MEKKYTAGRALLWAISGYHVLVGLVMLLSGELAIKAAKVFGGMTLQGGPEQGAIGEMFACYLIAFGLLMGAAAWNPVKNRAAVTIGAVLFALRI